MVPHSLYSLEDVASRLGLQVRTVRGYVRSGRLRAVKIGKQYRVSREDLEALTGNTNSFLHPQPPSSRRRVDVSGVIEVGAASAGLASRLSSLLIGSAASNRDVDAPLRVETIHDPVRACIKIVIIGDLSAVTDLFKLLQVVLEV